MLKSKGYYYLCVTRGKLKDYRAAKEQGKPVVVTVTMQDINDQKIYIRKCSKPEIKAREIY